MCVTAGLSALGSAAGIGSSVMDMFGKSSASKAQNAMNARTIEMAQADRRNQAMLTALGLRRSIAGTEDNLGNKTSFDVGGNTWQSELGPDAKAAQRSSDQAQTLQNTVQLPMQLRSNEQEALRSAEARRLGSPLIAEAAAFRPRTASDAYADNVAGAATANNNAMRPILADTLRANARTGTAQGPVIAALAQKSAENLRNALLTGRQGAPQQAASGNAAILDALRGRLQVIGNGVSNFGNLGPSMSNANATLTQLLASRAQGAAQPAIAGAASVPQSTYATMMAMKQAQPVGSPLASQILGIGDQIASWGNTDWMKALLKKNDDSNKPAGGDQRSYAYGYF